MLKMARKTSNGAARNSASTLITCPCCGQLVSRNNLFKSRSKFFGGNDFFIPTCKDCLEDLYHEYMDKYSLEAIADGIDLKTNEYYVEKKVIKRLCMMNDIYYSDSIFNASLKHASKNTMLYSYVRVENLNQYRNKTYDDTVYEEAHFGENGEAVENIEDAKKLKKINQKTVRFFGTGFSEDDYEFLQEEYADWTTRHECKTKAQEEIIKDICFNRLQNLKALRKGEDTKDITASFQKLLDSGKLQPKQNSSDALSDAQTFGTLIDKYENTRPLPEIDEDLKDVDKIGFYIDAIFRGHICKMLNVKNAFSNLYSKFMKKYTVTKPEYDSEKDSEIIFDTIFGNVSLDDEGGDNNEYAT